MPLISHPTLLRENATINALNASNPFVTDKPVATMHPSMLIMRPKSNGV
jgi:hypothetical protein